MSNIYVEASKVIPARAADIYAVIADYQVGHQAILPRPYFVSMEVKSGGYGAGTTTHIQMKVMGQEFHYDQIVTEPEPGRVIKETDINTGQWSAFTLDPVEGGSATRVTISSEFPASSGLSGMMERLFQPMIVRKIYHIELDNLAAYMQKKQKAG